MIHIQIHNKFLKIICYAKYCISLTHDITRQHLDTLLNVFLAIAVDNLTNAQEIGDDEKAEEREREKHKQEIKEKYASKGG